MATEQLIPDTLSQEELDQAAAELLAEAELRAEQKKAGLSDLAMKLQAQVEKLIQQRSVIEIRWLEALRQYHGYPEAYIDKDNPHANLTQRRKPRVNVTRPKCLTAISQMADLQFPARDKNFRITYTPVPELVRQQNDQDQLRAAVARGLIEETTAAAQGMERTIWDQLEASSWGPESRAAIRDLVILGTAIMKGPVVEGSLQKRWSQESLEDGTVLRLFDYKIKKNPAAKRVDPWFLWIDVNTPKAVQSEEAHQLHPLNKKELAQLSVHPYFDGEAIAELLEEPPQDILTDNMSARHAVTGSDLFLSQKYQVFEYHGKISDDTAELLGFTQEGAKKNPLRGFFGEIWYCQGHILKAELSPLEGDSSIPYVWTQWEEDETSPYGFGLPYVVADAQRVVNSTWRMILDNSGLAAGPQVVINREMIEPANDSWDLEPMKVWYATEWSTKPSDAVFFFTVPSNAEELASVMDLALRFADSESSMPLIAQGEEAALASTTATGLSLLLSTSNVIQKNANRNWDDDITVPLIDRFYTWNMLFNPDDSIKGDYEVVALGSTDLTARQLEAQDAATLYQAARDDPDIKAQLNMAELTRLFVSSMHLPAERVLLTPDEIKAQQQQQQADPKLEVEAMRLELEQAKLELAREKAQIEATYREAQIQLRKEELLLKKESIDNEWEQYVVQAQASLIREQNEREQKLIELASKEDITVQELLAQVQAQEKQEETKRVLAFTDFALKRQAEKREERELEARIKNMAAKPEGYDSFG